jgi:hypothetical protein
VPVVQLQNDAPENLGRAIGAVGGYLATQKQRKADKQQAQADKARTNAREDQEAADRHAETTSLIADRDAAAKRTATSDAASQLAQGAYQKYLPMLDSPPTQDGKPLKGPALLKALYAIRDRAFKEGMTDSQHLADFNTEIARVMQQNEPKISDVEHGLPQVKTSGKGAMTPAQIAQHYLGDATTRVLNSDLPDDQKKIYIDNFRKIAEPYLKMEPKALTPEQQYFKDHGVMPPTYQDLHPRPRAPSVRGEDGLTPGERLEERHWNLTHNPDGTPKRSPAKPSKPSEAAERDQDYQDMLAAIRKNPNKKDQYEKRFAAKWNRKPDDVDSDVPDDE